MDYSYVGAGNPDKRGFYFFNGQLVSSEAFGNLNYGYTGTAFGFGPDILYGAIAKSW
jgi:Bacterial toxin 44